MNILAELNFLKQESSTTHQNQLIPGGSRSAFEPFVRRDLEQSIPDRFEGQVRRHQNRLAAKDQNGATISYGELNDAANRIGSAVLAAIGDGEMPVVIMMEQNVSLLAAIMGTLKAGKFYVPVETTYAEARLQHVLNETGASLLLSDTSNHSAATKLGDGHWRVNNVEDIPAC